MSKTVTVDYEKEQVEWVFGLTGGELEDGSLVDSKGETIARFWYKFAPDYAERELNSKHDHPDFITAVVCEMYGTMPDEFRMGDDVYRKVETYRSSGETECPLRDTEDPLDFPKDENGRCVYCDESEDEVKAEGHGYIYLGDGWAEVVYVHKGW